MVDLLEPKAIVSLNKILHEYLKDIDNCQNTENKFGDKGELSEKILNVIKSDQNNFEELLNFQFIKFLFKPSKNHST